jgi:hypothetical protein
LKKKEYKYREEETIFFKKKWKNKIYQRKTFMNKGIKKIKQHFKNNKRIRNMVKE